MPSLNSLRAFEAAARLGSFARAAEELHTTSAGVAQHIKKVERWAEQPLFERKARGVELNEAGAIALPHLSEGFRTIGQACVALRAQRQRQRPSTLHIAALPALAQLWVVPRIAKIRALLPGVDISVHATDTPPDLDREPYDAAIFYAPLDSRSGVSDELIPVAAPHVAIELRTPADLAEHNLLHDRSWRHHWARWLTSAGVTNVDHDSGTSFNLYAMAIDAALDGGGILVGRSSLVERYLDDGSLVAPFDLRVETNDAVQIRFRDPIDPGLEPLLRLGED